MKVTAERIRIRGLVQGVGFRPTVWRLANQLGLVGYVLNDGDGVLIEASGDIDIFLQQLQSTLPPLARIDSLEREPRPSFQAPTTFSIKASQSTSAHTHIVPDAATCSACLADIQDTTNRRYRYAFTNCTHCGPRLSIVQAIPYDRANTTMQPFAFCEDCATEYQDPLDRRFHAQPNACPVCGPRLSLEAQGEVIAQDFAAIQACAAALKAGKIVAIKGLGGINLAVDACNAAAIARLRERKNRPDKPFALMAKNVEQIQQYCHLNAAERQALQSVAAPIVLLRRYTTVLPASLAPQQALLGFMLPYSPLHHLLLAELEQPIVLTSGNRSGQPQCISNAQSRLQLAAIADLQLLHNRSIANRVDDSVVRYMAGRLHCLRRARGYAPSPLALPAEFKAAPPVVALGADLKNTFALLRDGEVVLSQHIGDLDDYATLTDFQQQLQLYQALYQFKPHVLAIDLHPHYHASQFGRDWAERDALPLQEVQHHHAHLAACLADNAYPPQGDQVLGVILDGTGYGLDGSVWGGEFLLGDYRTFERVAHLQPVPLFGGTQAILQPWRMAYAHLQSLDWDYVLKHYGDLEIIHYLQQKPLATLKRMQQAGINSPLTSSTGRLFDAVAAVLGLCREQISFEGQAAMALEGLCRQESGGADSKEQWFDGANSISLSPLWLRLLEGLKHQREAAALATQFHQDMVRMIVQVATELATQQGVTHIALSGGVFQNQYLLEGVVAGLQQKFTVLTHQAVPSNDGGLALGQVAVAAARLLNKD